MYRQIGGKNGIHQKLVNRLGALDGVERIGWIRMKYKVKFAEFHSVMVEADSKKEA